MKHGAEGGTFAEEVISSVRTAQAFGTQRKLATIYDKHIGLVFAANLKNAIVGGVGAGVAFFIVYSSYALGKCREELLI